MFTGIAGDLGGQAMKLRATESIKSVAAAALMAVGLASFAAENGGEVPHSAIVQQALALVDVPYRYGGSTPSGFDCSGLVRYVFKSTAGLDLPRRTEDMSRFGQPIDRTELRPGDLVFFDTFRRAFSHVAIYIGDGRFLHAPARGGRVRVEALDDSYWRARFNGARRLLENPREDAPRIQGVRNTGKESFETSRITP